MWVLELTNIFSLHEKEVLGLTTTKKTALVYLLKNSKKIICKVSFYKGVSIYKKSKLSVRPMLFCREPLCSLTFLTTHYLRHMTRIIDFGSNTKNRISL